MLSVQRGYVNHDQLLTFFLKKRQERCCLWFFQKTLLTSSSLSSSPFVLRVDMLHSIWLDSSLINSLYILTRTGIDVHCSGTEKLKFPINYFPINSPSPYHVLLTLQASSFCKVLLFRHHMKIILDWQNCYWGSHAPITAKFPVISLIFQRFPFFFKI